MTQSCYFGVKMPGLSPTAEQQVFTNDTCVKNDCVRKVVRRILYKFQDVIVLNKNEIIQS